MTTENKVISEQQQIEEQHKMVKFALAQRFMDAMRAADFIMSYIAGNGGEIPDTCDIKMNILEKEPAIVEPNKPACIKYSIQLGFENIDKSAMASSLVNPAWKVLEDMVDGLATQRGVQRQWLTSQKHELVGSNVFIDIEVTQNMIVSK